MTSILCELLIQIFPNPRKKHFKVTPLLPIHQLQESVWYSIQDKAMKHSLEAYYTLPNSKEKDCITDVIGRTSREVID